MSEIARYVSELGADVRNCIPLIPVAGTPYESLEEPPPQVMRLIRTRASLHIWQMSHCVRRRADAAGLLGSDAGGRCRPAGNGKPCAISKKKPCIAMASSDGVSVNQHLGMATVLWIYRFDNGKINLVELRRVPAPDGSVNRWDAIAELIPDCSVLLVGGLGRAPYERLRSKGVPVESVAGNIREIAETLFAEGEIPREALRMNECGAGVSCSGRGR